MSRRYKNILKKGRTYGVERRMNLTKEILKDSTPLPLPLEYKDIDKEFRRWVDEDLEISFENEKLPTFMMLSNQRFSEYLQSWQHVDNKKNLILNFKTITRESNPKSGTIVGNTRNIPGDRTYLMKRVEMRDKNDRKYYIDYRVKQPFSVDLVYKVSLFTNKYELLNDFNLIMNDKFKAIDCYIRPNGHFIAMKITDISDESEYSIDNRQYYSQTYHITVMAYIMPKDSFKVEERPELKLMIGDDVKFKNTYAEIEDYPEQCDGDLPYEYEKTTITTHFDPNSSSYKLNIDCNFESEKITTKNIRYFNLFVNDTQIDTTKKFTVKIGDELRFTKVMKLINDDDSEIIITGLDLDKTVPSEKK